MALPAKFGAEKLAELTAISKEIASCRRCDSQGLSVRHSGLMYRGHGGHRIMVVGIEPGESELTSGEAFTGPAGQQLMRWLIAAEIGNSRNELLKRCLFTSLRKCQVSDKRQTSRANGNCHAFLRRQRQVVNPTIIVTLGQEPLSELYGDGRSLYELVGSVYKESDLGEPSLFSEDSPVWVCPLPHPSPVNASIHIPKNKDALKSALKELGRLAND